MTVKQLASLDVLSQGRAVTSANGWYRFGLTAEEVREAVPGIRLAETRHARPAELDRLEISTNLSADLSFATIQELLGLGVNRVILLLPGDRAADEIEEFVVTAGHDLLGPTAGKST